MNFAIIGSGTITEQHILALRQVEGANATHIFGRNEAKVRELAGKFNLSWTTNYQDIISNPQIDIVDIVLPSGLHANFGIEAAQAGKHVVVEKPIDVVLEKAKALIDSCKKNNVTLGVISQIRFSDGMQKIYKDIAGSKLGNLIQGDAYIKWYRTQEYYDSGTWRGTHKLDGGGAFINQGIHFIDLLLSVMGPVKSVLAKVRTVNHTIEVEDIGSALLEFASGAHGVIQASTALFPGLPARLEIHGSKGTVVFEGDAISFKQLTGDEPVIAGKNDEGSAGDPKSLNSDLFVRQFRDIVSAIHEKRQPIVSGDEAYKALQVVLAIYESSNSGRSITLKNT